MTIEDKQGRANIGIFEVHLKVGAKAVDQKKHLTEYNIHSWW